MEGVLSDRIGLVTGAGSGIGQMTALFFAREGAKVSVVDVDADAGMKTVQQIEDQGGQAIFIKCDVSKRDDVKAMVVETIKTFGRLDCAFNNAGISHGKAKIHDLPEADWDRVMNINLKGVWLCMKYELQHMFSQGKGAIVNASSINGLGGWLDLSAYVASKHGVMGLTRSAALEYAETGIRINAVCPGPILTPLSHYQGNDPEIIKKMYPMPMGRRGTMEEVAEAVVWLVSDKSSYITGHPLVLDGGFMAQ
jgi:NAD(P)-dependent dehydrogenase (short-subunit alcohol dehydrogenase family)